ncbi:MAG: DUF3078 domain-containing protein [Bacteroidetes bacterium]|nr:DUF3078 domain-containing protein [Bacteroidota bacterium]
MKIFYLLLTFVILSATAFAADETEEKKDTLWVPKGIVGLNLSQVSFENWTQGGDNSISFTFFSNFAINYIADIWKWRNSLKFTYGRTRTGNEGYKTNDNEIFFESTLNRNVGWLLNPYFGFSARTAVTAGFNYDETPPVQIVDFLDPFYLTEGIGLMYDQIPNFTTRLGLGFKQTFADEFNTRYTDDPDTPGEIESFKNETGIESVTEFEWVFLENMAYKGYLRLFGRFEDISVWDVRWDNTITAKINDYFNVNINVLLIYDVDETLRTQLKEALQLGISYTLF